MGRGASNGIPIERIQDVKQIDNLSATMRYARGKGLNPNYLAERATRYARGKGLSKIQDKIPGAHN